VERVLSRLPGVTSAYVNAASGVAGVEYDDERVRFETLCEAINGCGFRAGTPKGSKVVKLIMFGFLLQRPTLVTVVMFPLLVTVYARLAHREEREVRAAFGPQWDGCAARTPAFVPQPWRRVRRTGGVRNVHA
jgi:hypothetical protein